MLGALKASRRKAEGAYGAVRRGLARRFGCRIPWRRERSGTRLRAGDKKEATTTDRRRSGRGEDENGGGLRGKVKSMSDRKKSWSCSDRRGKRKGNGRGRFGLVLEDEGTKGAPGTFGLPLANWPVGDGCCALYLAQYVIVSLFSLERVC